MSMTKLVLITGTALMMAACGSQVKLDETPVEDRTSTAVAPDSSVVPKAAVTTVDEGKSKQDAIPAIDGRLVYFDYDSYVVKPQFQAVIEANAKILKADKSRQMVLEGHTDERGGREYNLALGQKRAEAVRRAMTLLGVADSQLEAVSFGKEKPAAQGTGEAAWSKNRRVEISYR